MTCLWQEWQGAWCPLLGVSGSTVGSLTKQHQEEAGLGGLGDILGLPGLLHSSAVSAERDRKPLSSQPRPCPQPSPIWYTSSFLKSLVPSGTSPKEAGFS